MKKCNLLTSAFLLTMIAAGPSAAQPASGAAQQYDVPSDGKGKYVAILSRDFAPGQMAGRHIHHGVEMSIVIHGDLELYVDGQAPKTYHAGQSFIVPRDVPHDAKNVGKDTVTLAVTYVNDQGTPLRIPMPAAK
jgi:quercetin dioxygenase-like cupin family protein